ncbi:MAG TPA: ATP-dependent DNA helicase [Methanocorpusculum sp.]|nr:ATP-dependent DNA helicase [Methanocorpusculum sp.]
MGTEQDHRQTPEFDTKPLRTIDELFPYRSYRPGQRDMLDAAFRTALDRKILMIDAPTGSGKSSLVVPLIAAAKGRKILIAVRSNSQLTIFQNELEHVRIAKDPHLKFSFIYGKQNLCPFLGRNVYRKCQTLREGTRDFFDYIHDRYSYATNPLQTDEYRKLMKGGSNICPYYARYLQSKLSGTGGDNIQSVQEKIRILQTTLIRPDEVLAFADIYCPYQLLWDALKTDDVIILNYHYLLRDDVRDALMNDIGNEESQVVLLLDEAHNIGEILKSIHKRTLSERTLATAEKQYRYFHGKWGDVPGTEESAKIIAGFSALFAAYRSRPDQHSQWELRPDEIFTQILGKEPEENDIYQLLHNHFAFVMAIHDVLKEDTFALMTVQNLLIELSAITVKSAKYLCIERSTKTEADEEDLDTEVVSRFSAMHDRLVFEILYLDPGEAIQDIIPLFHSAVMASGTLAPLESFKQYYFGLDIPVSLHSVPNAFPPENRLVLATADLTSLSSRRNDMAERTLEYIRKFVRIPGNVAVFFTSYSEMTKAEEKFRAGCEKPLYAEPKDPATARKMIEEFRRLPETGRSGILFAVCGGKWFEGIDFRGDQLKAAFVTGFPLGIFDGYQKKMNAWFGGKLLSRERGEFIAYSLPALNKTVQSLGRVLRNADETGILVLGDWRYLQGRLRTGLPDWMQKELRVCTLQTFEKEVDTVLAGWQSRSGEK